MQTKSSRKGVLGRRKETKMMVTIDCFSIFHFRDNLISIWLWCFYLFCFLFSRAYWIYVCFCLSVSIICLQLRWNLIFYLSNINLIFSRRLSFFSFFSSSSARNWLHVNLSFSWKVCSSPTGYSVALISGTCYLFIQREMVVTSVFPVLWERNSSALLQRDINLLCNARYCV